MPELPGKPGGKMLTVLTRQPCGRAGFKSLSRTATIIALVVLLVSIAALVTITVIQIHHKEVHHLALKYGIVLDAGSSRTTFYVYQWPSEKQNNTGVVTETYKCGVKGPGISSYGKNPQDAPKAFEECMRNVTEKIPAHLHESTQIHLGATAGMRLLRLQNETAADNVIASIKNYFNSQPFDFRDAQIISGQDEGVYGWITVNYLMGNFLEKNLWNMWVHPSGMETIGALDLGGASTQISFTVGENVSPNSSGIMQVTLYGYTYSLYTHSFLCYGRNEAEKKLQAVLLQKSSSKTRVINPCYPQGYITNFSLEHIFDSPCTVRLRPAIYDPDDTIVFEGTGDPAQCRDKVFSLFDFKACRDQEDCSFNGIYQPAVQGSFMAFSGFYYTVAALNLSDSFSLNTFNSSTWNFCLQNWHQLPLLLSKFDEKYARSYCFSAFYIYQLLLNGYRFTKESWPSIHFRKEVKNSSIAWSLGFMLNQTNQIPVTSHMVRLPMHPHAFLGALVFFIAVTLLCLLFLVYLFVSSKNIRHAQHAFDNAVDYE